MRTPELVLVIGAGGAVGTWLRYRLAQGVHARTGDSFPWGTLAVNVLGSYALGVLFPLVAAAAAAPLLRAAVAVGCIGAFTTFSSFALEAAALIVAGHRLRAAAYAGASVGLCLAGLMAGLFTSRLFL